MSGLDASGLSPYYLSASPLLQAITQPYAAGPGTAYQPNFDLFWLNQPGAAWPGTASPGGSLSTQGAGVSDWAQLSPEEFAAEAAPYIQHLRNITGPQQTPEQFAQSIAPYIEQQIAPQLEQLRAQQSQQLTPEQVNAIVQQQMAPQMQELQGMLGSIPAGVTAEQVQGMLANLPQQGVTADQVQSMLSQLPAGPTSAQVAQEITPYIEQQIMPYLSQIQGMLGNQQQTPGPGPTPAPTVPPAATTTTPPPLTNQYTPPGAQPQPTAPSPMSARDEWIATNYPVYRSLHAMQGAFQNPGEDISGSDFRQGRNISGQMKAIVNEGKRLGFLDQKTSRDNWKL